MSNKKIIKVGFEITDIWERGDFRQFIYTLIKGVDYKHDFKLYLITDNQDTRYANSVYANLDDDKIIYINVTGIDDKITALDDNGINIMMEYNQNNTDTINDESTNNTIAITCSEAYDRYAMEMMYSKRFKDAVDIIDNGTTEHV
jgi:hypothetical protein